MSRKVVMLRAVSIAALVIASAPAFAQATEAAPADQPNEEEIIVTGVRASMTRALEIKRENVQVVESIVAEDVGKLPDNNVVEALQRITGVQVTDRGAGQTGTISIRGMNDITTTWNGRNVFTASGRSFALADIPANLVKRVDVYKTRAADQIETGIAGQVDVMTRRPFDFDGLAVSATARGIYQEQADSFNPNVNALISDRWETGIGDIGALVSVSYERTKYRAQSITAGAMVPFVTENPPAGFVPLQRLFSGWSPGLERGLPTEPGSTLTINGEQVPYLLSRDAVFASDLKGTRERPAVNVALQWAPNPSSEYTFEFFWDGYRNTSFNNLHFTFADWWGDLGSNPGSTYELFDGTNIIKSRTLGSPFGFNSGDLTTSKTDSFVYALNGKWDINDHFKLAADLSYQKSKYTSSFLAMRTTRVANELTVDFNSGGGLPAWSFDDNALLADPAQWTVGEFYDNANRNKGDAITFQADGDYEFDDGFLRHVSFGIRYDDRGASEAQRLQDAPGLGVSLTSLDEGLQYYNKGFFDGRSDVPSSWVVANGHWIKDNADAVRALYQAVYPADIQLGDALALRETFRINEITMSAYLMADFEASILGRPLYIQAGGRYVDVDTNMDFIDFTTGVTTRGGAQTSSFLPSATLRYDITDDLRVRFNYGKTLRRPDFTALNPFINYVDDLTGVGYGTATAGNPNLKPTKATNYDIGLEWYFAPGSALYTTLFRREIDGLVVPFRSVISTTIPGNVATNYIVTRPENASNGVLKGIEVGAVLFPKELPGILNGFGLQGSLTYLDSKQNIPTTDDQGNVVGEDTSSFFGVSDLSYNVTLAYERGPIGARLSYVWRKNFLNNNEARLFANPIGIWRKPEKSLDFQLTAKVTDRLSATLDAVNLTDELSQSYYHFADAGDPETTNFGSSIIGRSFAIGLRYSFN